MSIYNKAYAIQMLRPNSKWVVYGDTLTWLDSGTAPTETEINNEITRLNNAEPMRLLRIERDKLLSACDYRASSDLTLADAWKTYRQSLRDLPASSTPTLDSDGNLDMSSVTFPTEPS